MKYHTLLDHKRTSTMWHELTNTLSRAPVNVQEEAASETLHVSLAASALAFAFCLSRPPFLQPTTRSPSAEIGLLK